MRKSTRALVMAAAMLAAVLAIQAVAQPVPRITEGTIGGDQLWLRFSEPMLTWGARHTATGLAIDPPIACVWHWDDDRTLMCDVSSQAASLRPATRYRLSVAGDLFSQQGQALPPQSLLLESYRPRVNASVEWIHDSEPEVELATNVPVTQAALRDVLRVLDKDGAPEPFTLSNANSEAVSQSWSLHFGPKTAPGHEVSVRVRPGLKVEGGELTGTQDEVLARVLLDEPFRLRRAGCGKEAVRADATIELQCTAGAPALLEFSSVPTKASIEAWKALLPPGVHVDDHLDGSFYSLGRERTDMRPGRNIVVTAERANTRFAVSVPHTLVTGEGTLLARDYEISLQTGDFATRLDSHLAQALLPVGARVGNALLATNTPALELDQRELGDGLRLDLKKKGYAPTPRNIATVLEPPAAARSVREQGGLVEGLARYPHEQFSYAAPVYNIAYAPFNVTVDASNGQCLVWTTEWRGAQPIASARVEVLERVGNTDELVLLGQAQTGADGVAVLDLPTMRQRNVLVRATRGNRRAIIALTSEMPDATTDRQYHPGGTADGERIAWGITDRPLYRPGESVHYRLWLRRREANRLAQDDTRRATFVLNHWGETASTFEAGLDAYGSTAGELKLPTSLRDNDYCIDLEGANHSYPPSGACFRVTSWRAPDNWVELGADRSFMHAGDQLELKARAGYYSGGPLVDARIDLQSLLTPLDFAQAYPAFGNFSFFAPSALARQSGGESFRRHIPRDLRTGADGSRRIPLVIDAPEFDARYGQSPIAFGLLEFTASIAPSSNQVGASASASLRFSRYPRFVGLRLDDWLLHEDADPSLEGVVATAEGERVTEADIHVRIDESPRTGKDIDAASTPLATCELHAGDLGTCRFRPSHSGFYRLTASSEGAAPATIERYAIVGRDTSRADAERPLARLRIDSSGQGRFAFELDQPFAKARVLFTAEHGRVLGHWIEEVDATTRRIEHEFPAAWRPGVTVRAIALDAQADPFGADLQRRIAVVASSELRVPATDTPAAVTLAVASGDSRPGDETEFTVRNLSSANHSVTVAVIDDAVRALAPDLIEHADPSASSWLGQLDHWDDATPYGLSSWNRAAKVPGDARAVVVFDQGDLCAGDCKLDTITVTGSNISAADVFTRFKAADHSLGQPQVGNRASDTAVRSRFLQTAYWNDAIELAPGEGKTLRFRLPDNLTRWRVLAWSNDHGDDFELAQATIEAKLPIEVRGDAPVRLFEGDTTTLAASVRNHGATATSIDARLAASGAGVDARTQWRRELAPNADQRIAVGVAAASVGDIEMKADARSADARDGIAGRIEVAATQIRERVPVAGWLPSDGVSLALPALPPGIGAAHLRIEASRGLLAQESGWIGQLRDYPHRCWEQILSRAVGAAVAQRLGLAALWPDADAAIEEALGAAKQFQDDSGLFHFFVGDQGEQVFPPSIYLTAYTVRAFELLASHGRTVPTDILQRAREGLGSGIADPRLANNRVDAEVAAALAVLGPDRPGYALVVDSLWSQRAKLGWSTRADLARLLAASGDDSGIRELRDAAPVQAGRRRVAANTSGWLFETAALEQCRIIATLAALDHAEDARDVQQQYLRGLADLYAGGSAPLDTQSMAQCLMALAEQPDAASREPLRVDASLGATHVALDVAAADAVASTELTIPSGTPPVLRLAAAADAPLASYVATLEYNIDGRKARRSGVGFGLDRSYSVLRGQAWKEIPSNAIREGDWVRVTLRLSTRALRRYVAVTDVVAGGLRPTDLHLAGVAGLDLLGAADEGSAYFSARQVDERHARFYAEALPPGTHEIRYYAQATHAGRYAALPAVAELMYGSASRAQTDAATIVIGSARP